MDILNLGGINEPSERPSKKKLKVIIGIGLLAGVMGMGSTLAASITLNGGTSVEFGQGVQYVTACDTGVLAGTRFCALGRRKNRDQHRNHGQRQAVHRQNGDGSF
jgi:hypothetical protein